jgi:transcriptional regulator with XRE-family HTH domain
MSKRAEFHVRGQPLDGTPLHYTVSGLDYVYLLNGFNIENDPEHGRIVSVEAEDDLLRAIGFHIICQEGPMTGKEIRFLRKQMGLTQDQLAAHLGVNVQSVANYEKGRTLPPTSDRLIRFVFALWTVPPDARASVLQDLAAAIQQELARRHKKRTRKAANDLCAPFVKLWAHGGGEFCHA